MLSTNRFFMRLAATLLIVVSTACGVGAPESGIVSIGDSLTLQTGQCATTDTLETCAAANRFKSERSYATYLPDVRANLGRGGDTCLAAAPYTGGPHGGLPRGVADRLDSALAVGSQYVSLLVGINDLNAFPAELAAVAGCIEASLLQIRASGAVPVALTYPVNIGLGGALQLNAEIRKIAGRHGILLVDVETLGPLATVDGIHPTATSAAAIADLWRGVVRP